MDKIKMKMTDNTPNFEHPNNVTPDNSPIGYPDMSGKLPESYQKLDPPKRKYIVEEGKLYHSINPERPFKFKMAQRSELKKMKLSK